MNIDTLLDQGLILAGELLQKTGTDIYQYNSLEGIAVPELDVELLEGRVIGLLKTAGRLPDNMRLNVEPIEMSDELLGIVMYFFGNVRIDIFTASHLNICKHRLVLCKELCQIYLDLTYAGDYVSNRHEFRELRKQIFDLIQKHNETVTGTGDLEISEENRSEFLSFFMAVNLIFPPAHWEDFKTLCSYLTENDTAGIKLYDLALAYRMPRFALKFFKKRMLLHYEKK